jgi:hypothetical protein
MLAAGESLLPQAPATYVCPAIGGNHRAYDYRLVRILQQTHWHGALTNLFGFVRTQVGRWSDRGKSVAWHWGIQLKKRGRDGYCTVGLKKTAGGGTALTSPDLYDSARCWQKNGRSKGCDASVRGMDWTPLLPAQAHLLDLVLTQKPQPVDKYGHEVKVRHLPFKFSYTAHVRASSSVYNCNRFANAFHARPIDLLQAIVAASLNNKLRKHVSRSRTGRSRTSRSRTSRSRTSRSRASRSRSRSRS